MVGTLIVFTRLPEIGRTKTRLIPALGAEGAALFHERLVGQAVATAKAASTSLGVPLEIHHTGCAGAMAEWLGTEFSYHPQSNGDLGERMRAALTEVSLPAVLIGTDCPDLTPAILTDAFAALQDNDVVLGPAVDGGYYLVGWQVPRPEIFRDIPWGGPEVLARTTARLKSAGLAWHEVATLHDIDRPEDLARVPRHLLADQTATGPKDT